jgi:sugar-specific transcriptional regulator TrmB
VINTLIKLGLTLHEANVYTAALQLGQTTALAISRKTGIKRTTVYDTLDSLTERGLIELQLKGLKRYFAPTNPDQFDKIISEQKKEYEQVLPDMLALYKMKGSKSQVRMYEGFEGVKTVLEMTLREIRTGDPWYVIDDQHNWQDKLDFKWLEGLVERRARKNVDFRIIFPDSERGQLNKKMATAWNQKVKLIGRPVHSDITITPQRFIIHSFTTPITTIVIENVEVIETQKNLFLALWDSLPE